MSDERRNTESAEERLDQLFAEAFETNSAPMHDYVALKFELKQARAALVQARREYGTFGSLSGETLAQMDAACWRAAFAGEAS